MSTALSLESLRADREFVLRQIDECPEEAWSTRLMWQDRLEDLDDQIDAIGNEQTNRASVAVVFDGLPVIGTRDIRLSFAVDALQAYQAIVSTTYAERLSGTLSDRGALRGNERSRLFISDLTRGSFGFILEELVIDQHELLPTLLKDVVLDSTEMLSSIKSQDDEGLGVFVEAEHPRLVAAIRQFAKVLADSRASARIVDEQHDVLVSVEEAQALTTRLRDVDVTEETIYIEGTFRGALPESRQFELMPFDAELGTITGPASSDLIQKYLNDDVFVGLTLKKAVRAEVTLTRTYRNGRPVGERFILENLQPLGADQSPSALPLLNI